MYNDRFGETKHEVGSSAKILLQYQRNSVVKILCLKCVRSTMVTGMNLYRNDLSDSHQEESVTGVQYRCALLVQKVISTGLPVLFLITMLIQKAILTQ